MQIAKSYKRRLWISSIGLLLGFFIALWLYFLPNHSSEETIDWSTLRIQGDVSTVNTSIFVQNIAGENTLILPSSVSPSEITLYLNIPDNTMVMANGSLDSVQFHSGMTLNLTKLCHEDCYTITFCAVHNNEVSEFHVNFLFSENISTVYLTSDDPVNQGRPWVESSADKSNKATGRMILQSSDGAIIYNNRLDQIKGRGNSTWLSEKKPYQIKLTLESDLLQTSEQADEAKTWVLLANHFDPSLLRNALVLDIGNAMNMHTNMQNEYVDLYYDGEYRGCYLLTEKVEIGRGRVKITDLEELNEKVNPNIDDFSELPIADGSTANGAYYTYCVGMQSPADISGGYLLEMDMSTRIGEEPSYFITSRGTYVVVKSPKYANQEEMEYIATFYQEYEDAVYDGGINSYTGKAYTDYVDLKSIVYCYLINELSKNRDGFLSSTYLCKEAGEEIMTMGPLWDYDLSLGRGGGSFNEREKADGLYTAWTGLGAALYKLGDFRVMVKDEYENTLYPLLKNIVLEDNEAVSEDDALHSLSYYRNLISETVVCNNAMWGISQEWGEEVDYLESFIRQRAEYLKETYSTWSSERYEALCDYDDVAHDAWYYEDVVAATHYGLMKGIGVAAFGPNINATRSQIAQVIFNIEEATAIPYALKFSDVGPAEWYTPAVIWANGENIIMGYPDGTFRPNSDISREDLIVLLYRYSGSPIISTNNLLDYVDEDSIADYARDAMEWAVSENLIKGYGENGKICPQKAASRAELATILVRFYEYCLASSNE